MDMWWKLGVIALIGVATAWLWIRLGLYGLGLPIGFAALIPLGVLGAWYTRSRQIVDVGVLVGAFALAWSAFEVWTWLNAAGDPAVSIPDWTPIPLAASVTLLLIGIAVTVAGMPEAD